VPPLRERRPDLFAWLDRLHGQWAARRGVAGALRFDADAAEALLACAWPLNLRALDRLVHELAAGTPAGGLITRAQLPAWIAGSSDASPARPAAGTPAPREAVPSREEFTAAFAELGGSVHGLARRFARDRRQIYRWVEAYGLADGRPTGKRKG
jgi:transcriptional regulator of acetoin/glycerol metabolism